LYPTAGFDVKIGIRYNGSGREFTGAIDDVRIYNRVLSDAEVAWLAGPVLIRLTLFALACFVGYPPIQTGSDFREQTIWQNSPHHAERVCKLLWGTTFCYPDRSGQ
jgi:hypothetical protein